MRLLQSSWWFENINCWPDLCMCEKRENRFYFKLIELIFDYFYSTSTAVPPVICTQNIMQSYSTLDLLHLQNPINQVNRE